MPLLLAQETLELYAYLIADAVMELFVEHGGDLLFRVFDEARQDLLVEEIPHDPADHVGKFFTNYILDLVSNYSLEFGAIDASATALPLGRRRGLLWHLDALLRAAVWLRWTRGVAPLRHRRRDARLRA